MHHNYCSFAVKEGDDAKEVIGKHLAYWSTAGWELVSTNVIDDGGNAVFFLWWKKPE